MTDNPDTPPKTIQKARLKFPHDPEAAYAWLFGEDALVRAKERRANQEGSQ